MSFIVTRYPEGTFAWADFSSTDFPKSKTFFESLFGWTSQDMPTGNDMPDYTMFSLDGHYVVGGAPSFAPGTPSFWSNFISVNDVDAVTAKAVTLGAKVMAEPMDVLDSGRMSMVTDPTGAPISFWQPKKHIGSQIVNTVGAMSWNELYTPDVEKSKQFYSDLLGWTYEIDEENGGYVWIFNNGRRNGGMMQLTPEMSGMPPQWVTYFTVANLKETMDKTKELGGTIHMGPHPVSVGSIAMLADPTGAAFMAIELSVPPDEWVE